MSDFMNSVERVLMLLMTRVSNQRHLSTVRDGLIATIPLTIIGAIYLLIPTFPWAQAYVDFMANSLKIVTVFLVVYRRTLGLLSVYVSFGIGGI